jgi:sulfatase maturation enzyme AslB (radical SAM superfamily)
LFTNGLLIKKQLDKTELLDRITEFRISIDAGSKEVYETVRKGGSWDMLLENFDFLQQQNLNHYVNLLYVVQKNNYLDIYNFVTLLDRYKFRGTLTQLDDWGTWNHDIVKFPDTWTIANGTFVSNNVLANTHPNYNEYQHIVTELQKQNLPNLSFTPRLLSLLGIHA